MRLSNAGAKFLAELEYTKFKAYKDAKGVWTIGVGHVIKKTEPYLMYTVLSKDEVIALLCSDVRDSEIVVNAKVKVPLNQNQFDALVIFTFNIGTVAFSGSTVLKELNEGDYKDACSHLDDWVKIRNHDGVLEFCKGLQNRRDEEQELFDHGDYTKQR